MKKIPTLFERDWNGDRSRIVNQVHEGCEWVIAGEGWPTRKLDGTSCMVRGGRLFKRREWRKNENLREGGEIVDRDEVTGKIVGWVPVGDGPEDKWHRDAFAHWDRLSDGTYELVGPKVQGNPENCQHHELVAHDQLQLGADIPRDFDGLREWLATQDIEGVVFHHSDGRMAKIKLRDFGLKRPKPI